MNRVLGIAVVALAALAFVLGFTARASATVTGTTPCPGARTYDWMGDSVAAAVEIPSLTHPSAISSYDGAILRPTDSSTYPGERPVVVIAHGSGGNKCSLFWAAQDLAGHGYIAVVWTAPGDDQATRFVSGLDAQRSAIAFVRTSSNPYLAQSDGQDIAVAGWSLGSAVSSAVQQDPDPAVRAAVAFDTLHEYIGGGELGGVTSECTEPPGARVVPRVPALGFAMDHPCPANPSFAPRDLKLGGFEDWRQSKVPAAELVMRGFAHGNFATAGDETQWHDLSHYMLAWLDRYLLNDAHGLRPLFSDEVNGRPATDVLSADFDSAVYEPESGINTEGFSDFLEQYAGPPRTIKLKGPGVTISKKRVRRGHARYEFDSSQPGSSFRCRVDDRRWRDCSSPFVLGKTSLGHHTVKAVATDPSGLRSTKSISWPVHVVRG